MSEEEKGKKEGEIAIKKEINRQTGRESEGPRQRMFREREREREREKERERERERERRFRDREIMLKERDSA
jgi:hypothetical protein